MSILFEGQTFATLRAFQLAFPAYANYGAFLKDGVSTIPEMEKRVAAKQAAGKKAAAAASRRGTPFTFNRKGQRR